jgi:hypothetical protein
MEIPPWHVGHVVKKLMLAHTPKEMKRKELAKRAGIGSEMTITNMIRYGRSDDATIEKVAAVFGLTAHKLRDDAARANQEVLAVAPEEQRRRATDRPQAEVDAEQYARRLMRLTESAQNAIFFTIRAFEALLSRRDDPEVR